MSSGAATSSLADGSAVKPISIQVSVVVRVASYWGVVMAKRRIYLHYVMVYNV